MSQNFLHELAELKPISLEQMSGIKLMNRLDNKYVANRTQLARLLKMVKDSYFVQELNGKRISPYRTVYFDTVGDTMYMDHHNGRADRIKVRVRTYEDSNLTFLEVKHKNNKGRTDKKRIKVDGIDHWNDMNECEQFVKKYAHVGIGDISAKLMNHFDRITLVNYAKTERLTIDLNLQFDNSQNGCHKEMGDIVIIELKRDGHVYSPVRKYLYDLRIMPMGFSKYCIGRAVTDEHLKQNRFKTRIRTINKIKSKR